MAKGNTYTPMIKQYLEVKQQHLDAIVFYRLGDFYEMFFEDAQIASQELDLVLTGRNAGVEKKIPMCGVPFHAANSYIQRLIQKGYKVAIVEQLENAEEVKGLVKRDVIKIVTPGTNMDEINDEKNNIYLASLYDFQYGLAVVLFEMTTGELKGQIIPKNMMSIQKALLGNNVREVVLGEKFDSKVMKMIKDMHRITLSQHNDFELKGQYESFVEKIEDERLKKAFALLTNYLDSTQKRSMSHLKKMELINEQNYLQMDFSTKQNLELTQLLRSNSKSLTLWSFLDKCQSSMGSRLLKKWIESPLVQKSQIEERLEMIEYLNENFIMKDELREHLSNIYDLERLCARIAYGSASPRDVLRLIKTLQHAPMIFELLQDCKSYEKLKQVDVCSELLLKIDGAIVENPPLTVREGDIFVDGYHEELDDLRDISKNGNQWILELEAYERDRTGIRSLKVGYNRVFGYYIEVTKMNVPQIKEEFGYVRKQTLTNAERYVTSELKEKEEAIIHAKEKIIRLESDLFMDLLEQLKVYLPKLYDLAAALSTVDALYSLAEASSENGYTKPIFHNENRIILEDARHPILEKVMKGKPYISNDLMMDEKDHVMMITGPNMGGKSTYMRQTALIAIMAQIGCFVPAKKAHLPIFDKIFTRIGASDDIMSGQSTFMVEMMEANHALQNATKNSLILFDEIGRGTSTYDGMALAQAMIEYITNHIQAKTLFSTHYHELTELATQQKTIKNVHVEVHEENEHVTFLYRMIDGKADKSYGINVARLAKLPLPVLERAKVLLLELEKQESLSVQTQQQEIVEIENPNYNKIKDMLKLVDINAMTPLEALQFIADLKTIVKE
ncbi:MAG: DNA mismatch repair protein MutS [Erysipelotrichaceae bacterium]|nr:DNA mismatch repair protein MutS [Erysipelotrichaceae bacterium]